MNSNVNSFTMTAVTGDQSFVIPGEQLMDKNPVSAQMQESIEVTSSNEAMETEESAEEELDLHVCGKCKAEFTNIQHYVDHKRLVCSKRSPGKGSKQVTRTKAKKQPQAKQIISSTSAVTAIIEPQVQSFCETVIEEGVVVDDQGNDEAQQEIIKAARASENQDVAEKAKDSTKEKKPKLTPTKKTEPGTSETEPTLSGMSGPFKCNVCDKVFDRPETLVVHQFMHKKFHQCNDCKRSFVSEENLNKHKKEFKHVFKCKICLLEFPSQNVCKSHETSHTRQHECVDCKKKFYTEKTLERHREKVLHNLPCDKCDKICRDKHALTKHQESHTRVKSHVCDYEGCDRGFRSASELAKHKKCVHLGIKDHKCEECGKEFARKDKLNRHLLIHSPNRPTYPCPFKTFTGCAKTFYRKDKLQRHIFAHSKEKPYKCETCSKLFARKDNLTEHMRIHTGEFKHRCPVCNKGMGGPKKLLLHVQQKHSGANEIIPDKPTMVASCLPPTTQVPTVNTATADSSAASWVQENIADDKMQEEQSKPVPSPEDSPETSENVNTNQDEEEQHQEDERSQYLEQQQRAPEVPQKLQPQPQQQQQLQQQQQQLPPHQTQQQQQLTQHQPQQQQISQHQLDKEHSQQQQRPQQHRQQGQQQQQPQLQHQQVTQQHVIQQQLPPQQQQQQEPRTPQPPVRPPPPLQQQHIIQPQGMVVHPQVPPTSAARVAVHYLSNNNVPGQPRGQYVPALHQAVPNVTQSETALLHEVLSELATRSLFNS